MLEKEVERYLIKKVKNLGGMCLKFESPGFTGVPDRIVLVKNKPAIFVELKRPIGGRLSARQRIVKFQFEELGKKVYVLKNKQEVDDFIKELIA